MARIPLTAILLATALHRWWPNSERPAIADLGPYLLLQDDGLPVIAGEGGIVVVQDVLDRKRISTLLVERLKAQGKEVLCILSLAQLVDANDSTHPIGATNIDAWDSTPVRAHAMINLERPARCEPGDDDDPAAYWVEPRTLRPFRYDFLRRRPKQRNVPKDLERPDFYSPKQDGVLCAGHYVYGERHYTIALDIKRALDGEIGDETSAWLARICMGSPANPADWETSRSSEFTGAVTAVLMPLHSQIHYLWPKVEILLAQRGRRQPMWLLDATLFLGHGAAYRLPLQFQDQVDEAMRELLRAGRKNPPAEKRSIRLLIVDDAMVRARTAETILAEIDRAVRKARDKAREEFGSDVDQVDPIEWIKYFAIFDQMGDSRRQHWRNLTRIGYGRGIPFLFERYASISGVPDYEESNCPACAEIERLQKLAAAATHVQADVARTWAEKRLEALRAVAIDAPGFQRPAPSRLPRPIDLLARTERVTEGDKLRVGNADEAILRFFELTYLSYPPVDIIRSLQTPNAWALESDPADVATAYERFRWAVLGWCLQKWPRLVADSARNAFINAASAELEAATPLAECLFEGIARHRHDDHIKDFVVSTLHRLRELEQVRRKLADNNGQRNAKLRVLLADVLTLFLLSIPPEELRSFEVRVDGASIQLLDYVGLLASSILSGELSFLGGLHLQFTRPRRFAEPSWALHSVAETLLRGRDPSEPAGSHRLLPRLLYEVKDCVATTVETWRLLQANLNSFLAALDDLSRFSVEPALPIARVKVPGDAVLAWLGGRSFSTDAETPREVEQLIDELDRNSEFCRRFNEIFHQTVADLRGPLEERAAAYQDRLEFEFAPREEVKMWHVLAELASITEPLTNWAIDAAKRKATRHMSRIEVRRQKVASGKDWLRFRILTNFDSLSATNTRVVHGTNYDVEVRKLKLYGADLPEKWEEPTLFEITEGFTAAYQFDMPAGFIPTNNL